MAAKDTTRAAEEVQLALYARLSGEQRVAMAARMSAEVRDIARAGIRARHPEYSPREVELALLRALYGDELFARAWRETPLLDP